MGVVEWSMVVATCSSDGDAGGCRVMEMAVDVGVMEMVLNVV